MSKTGWAVVGIGSLVAAIVAASLVSKNRRHHLTPFIRSLYARIARHFPFSLPPLIEDWTVGNAQSDGRSVRVNPAWVEAELKRGCTDEKCTWSFVMGVLAHELGHHAHRVDGALFGGHAEELVADEIAGRVLAAEGIPADDFARILSRLSAHGSESHPDGFSRSRAIARGYRAVALA
jgi:hypothetical protein